MNINVQKGESHIHKTFKHHTVIFTKNRWDLFAILTIIVSMTILLSGCVSQILSADFDSFSEDTVDLDFVGNLSGLPDGDAVESHPFINGSLTIEANGPADGGYNLRIIDVSPTGIHQPALISFVVTDHELPDEYRIVWVGATEALAQHTEVVFLDESGHEALRLTFTDQADRTQVLIIGSGMEGVAFIDVNPTTKHEVLVNINYKDKRAEVRYDGFGGIKFRQNLALKDPSFNKLRFVRFAGLNTIGAYYLSHINVVAKSN